jgi:folate-binding protein YgfZ
LEKYIIADDVQVVDVMSLYGLLSIQGPEAASVIAAMNLTSIPSRPFTFVKHAKSGSGEIYLMNNPRYGSRGFDFFVPNAGLTTVVQELRAAAEQRGGSLCGWQAAELVRVEAGIPRFGADMDENNLPLEAGLEERAISFSKGCYIGQEVISRIRTYSQVAKSLRGLRLPDKLSRLPARGDLLWHGGKEVGYVTSAVASPALQANIALGYVRKEVNQLGTELVVQSAGQESRATIVQVPFQKA